MGKAGENGQNSGDGAAALTLDKTVGSRTSKAMRRGRMSVGDPCHCRGIILMNFSAW